MCPQMRRVLANFLWQGLAPDVRQGMGWAGLRDVECSLLKPRAKQFVEFFCGTGGLSTACSEEGLRSSWFDIALDSEHDLLSARGFALSLSMALSLAPGAVAWFGVPCSTFVWISRSHTLRRAARPLGDARRLDVREANTIVRRINFIFEVLARRSVYFIIEQPSSSLLWALPVMRRAARTLRIKKHVWQRRFVWLGHFGHEVAKPTELQGIFPGLPNILPSKRPRKKASSSIYRTCIRRGKRRVTGGARLKTTGHYPRAFCVAVARLVRAQVRRASCA